LFEIAACPLFLGLFKVCLTLLPSAQIIAFFLFLVILSKIFHLGSHARFIQSAFNIFTNRELSQAKILSHL